MARSLFLSYRRADAAGHSGRIYDVLTRALGPKRVFRDIQGIEIGSNFVKTIEQEISHCSAMLVVIGPDWLTCEKDGKPRISHEDDVVRAEIRTALQQDVTLIPVLVGGASMPAPEYLPDDIRGLALRNAVELSESRWDYDISRILETLGINVALSPTGLPWPSISGIVLLLAAGALESLSEAQLRLGVYVTCGILMMILGTVDLIKARSRKGLRQSAGVVCTVVGILVAAISAFAQS